MLILQRVPVKEPTSSPEQQQQQTATSEQTPSSQSGAGQVGAQTGLASSAGQLAQPTQQQPLTQQLQTQQQQQQQQFHSASSNSNALKYMVMAGTGEKMLGK